MSFSLTEGGPFHRLLVRLRVRTPVGMKRAWLVGPAVWLPIAIGEGVRATFGLPLDPMALDLSLHVRLLFVLPVVLLSEQLLERTSQSAITSFYNGRFCDRASVDRILARAERLRDSWGVEAALLGLGILGGQFVLWRIFGSTGWIHGGGEGGWLSFPRFWYALVALPLVHFVMLRVLWRWVIWSQVLARLSRLPLFAIATHADLAAGLTPLSRPVVGFSGFVLANGALLAGAWGTQLLEGRTTLDALLPGLATFILIATAIAFGPLLSFSGQLFRARRRALAQYGDFMRDYTLRFHAKWIERPPGAEQPLGSPDIQSLSDLGQAFGVIQRTRVFAFGPRVVLVLWLSAVLPMAPLFASSLPVDVVLRQIVTTVIGGFPI
jgi:hypothetical protein